MAAVERELIRRDDGLALLFAPPFDKSALDPGYIKAYPPGVRENGGQYTHAALWSVMAFAALGDGDKAVALFSLLNPINHARTRTDVLRYKVEPYVVAADVYATPPHVGRGGWTWYTGSAGWMQRAGVESILGLRMRGALSASRSLHSQGVAEIRDDAFGGNRRATKSSSTILPGSAAASAWPRSTGLKSPSGRCDCHGRRRRRPSRSCDLRLGARRAKSAPLARGFVDDSTQGPSSHDLSVSSGSVAWAVSIDAAPA